jgi:hypothetical protein
MGGRWLLVVGTKRSLEGSSLNLSGRPPGPPAGAQTVGAPALSLALSFGTLSLVIFGTLLGLDSEVASSTSSLVLVTFYLGIISSKHNVK